MRKLDRYLNELHSNSLQNNYVIRPSPIHGNGVFAKQDFKKGEFINTHFEPGEKITDFGAHLNHCSDPTARSDKQDDGSYKTYAEKDIKKDDEVTLDYAVNQDLEQAQPAWNENKDTVFGQGTPPDPRDETYMSLLKGTTMGKVKVKIKETE